MPLMVTAPSVTPNSLEPTTLVIVFVADKELSPIFPKVKVEALLVASWALAAVMRMSLATDTAAGAPAPMPNVLPSPSIVSAPRPRALVAALFRRVAVPVNVVPLA